MSYLTNIEEDAEYLIQRLDTQQYKIFEKMKEARETLRSIDHHYLVLKEIQETIELLTQAAMMIGEFKGTETSRTILWRQYKMEVKNKYADTQKTIPKEESSSNAEKAPSWT